MMSLTHILISVVLRICKTGAEQTTGQETATHHEGLQATPLSTCP